MTTNNSEHLHQIHFRVTPKEYEMIRTNQTKTGLRMSEYARKLLMGNVVVTAPPADLNILIREIKRVGSNLNQLLRKLNSLGIAHSYELDNCASDIQEVLKLIYQTYRPEKGEK